MEWYKKEIKDILTKISSNLSGLSQQERTEKLENDGYNILEGKKKDSKLKMFFKHFNDLLIYVLIVAALLKAFGGQYIDMIIIFMVVVINAIIGYFQEQKASNSLASLTSMLSSQATILVAEEKMIVDTTSLVVGDIVLLSPGDIIPADLRIFEAHDLVVEEAILTGESTPVNKNNQIINESADLGDRFNMAYSGTLVNSGMAKGIVVATGKDTELGKISQYLNEVEKSETPLLVKMKQLNKQIFSFLVVLIVLLLVFIFLNRDLSPYEIIEAMIVLAVSAVPEGLPAVLSIILSLGVSRMASKKAIIKKMPAVETLGSMSVICSDKTGTLTKNEMSVVNVITLEECYDIDEANFELNFDKINVSTLRLVETAMYCNDTKIKYENNQRIVIGDPTEGALLDFAAKAHINEEFKIINKIPFDSKYKYMAVLVVVNDEKFVYVKGAPDVILNMVNFQSRDGVEEAVDQVFWHNKINEYAKKGQRVLAAAYKKVEQDDLSHESLASDLKITGLYGIIDPPKKAAIEAIAVCLKAGVQVKMITGDHIDTARAIGQQIGLAHPENALLGSEVEKLSDDELASKVLDYDVFARTTPEHKLRLVNALQSHGKVVGMTGDGVNDAPALKKADIGIAMGIKGTQVTKDASDMVLADDNFQTIATALKEGRRVYDNLKNTIIFALPTAFAQGLLVVIALLAHMPLPLTSVQILWLNMVTTITLSFALGFEPLSQEAMTRKPRDPKENILDKYVIFRIVYVSLIIAGFGFIINEYLNSIGTSLPVIQTTLLQAIVFAQLFYMINCRKLHKFSVTKSITKNKVLWISVISLVVIQTLVIYAPFMNAILATKPLSALDLGLALLAGIIVFVVVELEKAITRTIKKTK